MKLLRLGWRCRKVAALALLVVASAMTDRAVAGPPASNEQAREVKRSKSLRVFGEDDRLLVNDTTVAPYASMGMIIARWEGPQFYQTRMGTGTLISDRVVLSCAHVVYEPTMGLADSITFYPGYNDGNELFGAIEVVTGVVRDAWIDSRDDNEDISLLLLDKSVGRGVGFMAVASRPASFFSGPTLNLTGYAGDLGWGLLYEGSGPATGMDGNLIVHYIDGGPGQSGGPLWYFDDATGLNTIAGIFTGDAEVTKFGQVTDVYGIGVRINADLCAWISDYLVANDPTATPSCDGTAGEDPMPSCGRGIGGIFPFLLATLALMRRTRRP